MNYAVIKKYGGECIGTFLLTCAVLITANPLAVGLMLAALVYVGASISGGHYNPAVTIALWLQGKFSLYHVPGYLVAQVLGAFGGGIFSYYLLGKIVFAAPLASLGFMRPLMIEMMGAFLFVLVVLETTISDHDSRASKSLMIGLGLATVAFLGGTFSGGAFNPAVGIGPLFFDFLMGGKGYQFIPLYLIGPLGGCIVASLCHYVARRTGKE